MLTDTLAHAVIEAANAKGIEPAALLAIVEVETGGKTFEEDGRTPSFLYERHVAWREATKRGCLPKFRAAGLAIPKWNRATQYKDERTSSQRLALIGRARAIDAEVACRSASWGIGQTMGNLAESLGFVSGVAMVDHMTGNVPNQIDCLCRELQHTNLIHSLNAHDWPRVARVYNGPGYRANNYDAKLRDAYTRWSRKLPHLSNPPPEDSLAPDEIKTIQQTLRDLGFHEVGSVDGHWGTRTTGALSAFQAHQGLPVTGHYDEETAAALNAAEIPRPVAPERENATVDDLRDAGSDTIANADKLSTLGATKIVAGSGVAVAGVASQAVDNASEVADKLQQAHDVWDKLHGVLGIFHGPHIIVFGMVLLVAGIAIAIIAERIRVTRLADHRSGVHAGPEDQNA